MAEVSKMAENPITKFVIGVVQALLIAAAIGSYSGISGSLDTIKTQLSTINTDSALQKQRIDSLERSRDSQSTDIKALSTDTQRQGYDINQINNKLMEMSGRDKSRR